MNDYAWRWANEHKEEHGVHVRSRIRLVLQGILWIFAYIILSTAPLFVLLIGPRPPGREFWRELSVALGFAGLAMVTLQFVLTARFKVFKAPYGSDIVYYFHRQISLVAFALVLAHPLLLFAAATPLCVNESDTAMKACFDCRWTLLTVVMPFEYWAFKALSKGKRYQKIQITFVLLLGIVIFVIV